MASRDWNDMALVSEDKSCLLKQTKIVFWWNLSFDESCPVMKFVFWWKIVKEVIKDVYWWVLSIDESCLLMKVVFWWKLPIDENCLLMKVIYWWKLSSDGSCLLMKVIIVKEVISWDVSPLAMFLFCFFFCRSNPWPNESLPRVKSTPQQCGTHSWSCPGTFSDPHRESNLGPLGWQPSPLTTRLSETS